MESKEFLVPNPLLNDNSIEKYIWIGDSSEEHRNAQYLFGYFMKRNIYINGFATKLLSLVNLKMYNKRIHEVNSLLQEQVVVFYDIWIKDLWRTYKERGHRARIINPEMDREKVVIWGSGITGENAFKLLREKGIKVCFFVDSDKRLDGTTKCGIPVCSPDRIQEDFVIIEAMEQWRQLDEEISSRFSKRFHFSLNYNWDLITCDINGIEKDVLSLSNFWSYNRFEGKSIYVYGVGNIEKSFVRCLKLMDYEFGGYLVDDKEKLNTRNSQCKNVEDILYEENYYVWVYDETKSQKLRELGLRHYFEYECPVRQFGIVTDAKFCIDVNLGFNYLSESKYPGMVVYGTEGENDYKIAVLGGSTTDGTAFPFKTWSQILYEKLRYKVTLYNGGVSGYVSGQELFKLIRDILSLKPDMIIVYDGFNEINIDVQNPFAFPYAMKVVNCAAQYLVQDIRESYERVVTSGVRSGRDFYSNWLFNLRNMYAISRENNIEFLAFCQPELSSKRGKTIQEKNMLLSAPTDYILKHIKEGFRNCIEKTFQLPDYIYDLSHIFDSETDVYMDSCHVWEKGNQIIAEEIVKVVLPKIEKCVDEKKRKKKLI